MNVNEAPQAPPKKSSDDALPIISMVFGVFSLTGPGFIFGIPAIITAAIALKKKLGNKGLSITGLVTGIISTLVSLLIVGFIAFVVIWGLNNPQMLEEPVTNPAEESLFESAET